MAMLNTNEKAQIRSHARGGDLLSQAYIDHEAALAAIRGGAEGEKIDARVALATNRALSGLAATDGVTPVAGDIALLAGQTTTTQNGLYVAASGAWARLKDVNGADVLKPGMIIFVSEGTLHGNTFWTMTNDAAPVIGTDTPLFVKAPNLADLASTAAGKGSALIGDNDTGGLYTATTVAGQLQEVKAIADAAIALQKRTVTVGHADLTDADNGDSQTINVGAVLPANAVLLAHSVVVTTPFSGGTVSALKMDLGGTDIDGILAQLELITDAPTAAEKTAALGILPQGSYSAQQLVATFDPDAGNPLVDLTAGEVVITVWFSVLA